MAIIDQHCAEENAKLAGDAVKSEYNFLYVPVDFKYGCWFFPLRSVHFPYNHESYFLYGSWFSSDLTPV